jgi:hypothetical protein
VHPIERRHRLEHGGPVVLEGRQLVVGDDLGATVAEWLNVGFRGRGESFLSRLERGP